MYRKKIILFMLLGLCFIQKPLWAQSFGTPTLSDVDKHLGYLLSVVKSANTVLKTAKIAELCPVATTCGIVTTALTFYKETSSILVTTSNIGSIDYTTAAGLTLNVARVGGMVTGYIIPGLAAASFLYSAYIMAPQIFNAAENYTYNPLDELAPSLPLSTFFTDRIQYDNSSYLSCAYYETNEDKQQNKPLFWDWVKKSDLPPELAKETPLRFYNDYGIIYGRWVKSTLPNSKNKTYSFITVDDPFKIQATCLNMLTNRIKDKKFTPTKELDINNLIPKAGNITGFSNIPIYYYLPVKSEKPEEATAIKMAP